MRLINDSVGLTLSFVQFILSFSQSTIFGLNGSEEFEQRIVRRIDCRRAPFSKLPANVHVSQGRAADQLSCSIARAFAPEHLDDHWIVAAPSLGKHCELSAKFRNLEVIVDR